MSLKNKIESKKIKEIFIVFSAQQGEQLLFAKEWRDVTPAMSAGATDHVWILN